MIVWSYPYCPMRKASTRFDDLQTHVRAIHWRRQPLHPPKASLECLDWREERESRRRVPDDDKEPKRTRQVERRTRSPQGTTLPPRKVVRRSSPATSSLGVSPGVLLSPLPVTPRTSPRKRRSPRKPVKSEETVGSSQEEPAPVTGRAFSDPVPGPSRPDTSVPELQDSPQDSSQDLPPCAVALADVREYLAAAGEEERAKVHADLAPDTREGGYQAKLMPVRRKLQSFPTQTPSQTFNLHRNPDGSVSPEHPATTIRIHGTLMQQD